MKTYDVCLCTLALGHQGYSPKALRQLFDGEKVSPLLDFTPLDPGNPRGELPDRERFAS